MNQKIRELQNAIEKEREIISRCNHIFGSTIYDPYDIMEPYGFTLDCHGSDCWSVPTGYHKVTKHRWKRICSKCGFEQFTEKTEIIIKESGTRPKFD